MKAEHHSNQKVSALFQGLVFLIAFTCLFIFFSIRYHYFIPHDPKMPLMPAKHTEKHVLVGLHVSHFSTFDIVQNRFVMDGTIWFLFNPNDISINEIKKFDVFNGEIQRISDPKLIDHGDSKIAQFRLRAEFNTPLNYRMFPLDDHRVNFVIFNHFLPDDVTFQSINNDITFSDSLFLPGWRIVSHDVRTGIKKVMLEKDNKEYTDLQQEAIISFDCERTDPSIMINMLLTLLLMLFLATLTFSSNEDSVLIVTVGIVALIGYRSVMQTMSPPQVSYFMFSDYMYLYALVCIIITLFADIIARDRAHNRRIKKCYIAGVYALFAAACIATTLLIS